MVWMKKQNYHNFITTRIAKQMKIFIICRLIAWLELSSSSILDILQKMKFYESAKEKRIQKHIQLFSFLFMRIILRNIEGPESKASHLVCGSHTKFNINGADSDSDRWPANAHRMLSNVNLVVCFSWLHELIKMLHAEKWRLINYNKEMSLLFTCHALAWSSLFYWLQKRWNVFIYTYEKRHGTAPKGTSIRE